MPPEGPRKRLPSEPGTGGYRLARPAEETARPRSIEPAPAKPSTAPPSARDQARIFFEHRGVRVGVPLATLLAVGPWVWAGYQKWQSMETTVRETANLAAAAQKQIDELKSDLSKERRERAEGEKLDDKTADWNAAVFSQALGIDVRRPDEGRPLPVLRLTFPNKKRSFDGAHVVIETPQPVRVDR